MDRHGSTLGDMVLERREEPEIQLSKFKFQTLEESIRKADDLIFQNLISLVTNALYRRTSNSLRIAKRFCLAAVVNGSFASKLYPLSGYSALSGWKFQQTATKPNEKLPDNVSISKLLWFEFHGLFSKPTSCEPQLDERN